MVGNNNSVLFSKEEFNALLIIVYESWMRETDETKKNYWHQIQDFLESAERDAPEDAEYISVQHDFFKTIDDYYDGKRYADVI